MKKPVPNKKSQPSKPVPPKKESISHFNFDRWLPLIVSLFGLLLYVNTLHHGYVLDDEMVMAKNKTVTQGISAIPEILTSAYREGFWDHKDGLYRPLSLVMFALEWQVAPNQPMAGHLMNMLLYALTGFFLYKLLRAWFYNRHVLLPFCIALLFMAHPLHTEVVANIKSRDEILGLLFAVLAMWQYQRFAQKTGIKYLLMASVFFLLAVLSKESYLTLFLGIPLAVYFFSEAGAKKYVSIFGSLTLIVGLYFCLRIYALGELVTFNKIDVINNSMAAAQTAGERFAMAVVLGGMYLRLFVFPHPLSFDYSFNSIPLADMTDPRFLLSLLVLVILVGYALLKLKKRDAVSFGILFFCVTISIVSNLVLLIECTLAERFMYLPSLGLCIAAVFLLAHVFKTDTAPGIPFKKYLQRNKLFFMVSFLILVLFSVKVVTRNPDWRSDLILFGVDKEHNPQSWRTNFSYANAFYYKNVDSINYNPALKEQLSREVLAYLEKSMKILPDNIQSWYLLGLNLLETGQLDRAYPAIMHTIELDSTDANARYVLGNWYAKKGDYRTAIAQYEHALRLNPEIVDACNNMGNCYGVLGEYDKALEQFNKVLALEPDHVKAKQNIEITYKNLAAAKK